MELKFVLKHTAVEHHLHACGHGVDSGLYGFECLLVWKRNVGVPPTVHIGALLSIRRGLVAGSELRWTHVIIVNPCCMGGRVSYRYIAPHTRLKTYANAADSDVGTNLRGVDDRHGGFSLGAWEVCSG